MNDTHKNQPDAVEYIAYRQSKRGLSHLVMRGIHAILCLLPIPMQKKLRACFGSSFRIKSQPHTNPNNLGAKGCFTSNIGINVIGYVHAELGVGEASRSTLRALHAASIPTATLPYHKGVASRMNESLKESGEKLPIFPVNIFHINADQLPYVMTDFEPSFIRQRYNVGYWNWEMQDFPDDWLDSFSYLNEVWAPSTFCLTSFAAKSPIPVRHIPYCIRLDVDKSLTRSTFDLPENDVLFFFMIDAHSIPERKNPEGLLEAFRRARPCFKRPAQLIVKMINANTKHPLLERIRQEAERDPDVRLLETYLDRTHLNAFLNCMDAYVSLHRSEGFGLTLAEAMYLGKPVIATGWSANTDFMNNDNSYLVPHELSCLKDAAGPYKAGQFWANPDLNAAARAMVEVVNDPTAAALKASRGKETIHTNFSPEAVGRKIWARLHELGFSAT